MRLSRAAQVAGLLLGLPPVAAVVWPGTGKLGVLLVAIAIVGALHGLGRLVGWLAGDDDAPAGLALVWGLAAYLGIAGLLIALGQFGPAAQVGLIAAGGVLGAGWLWRNAPRVVDVAPPRLSTLVVIALAAAVAAVIVLSAAGRWSGPFTDAETSYLAQLQRLHDTGGLADGFGFPRTAGLGGEIAIRALASPLDPRSSLLVDRGVMFAVVVLLALVQVRSHRARLCVAATLPIAMTAIPEYLADMAPHWSVVALVLGTALSFDRALERRSVRAMFLTVLTASATATIGHPGAVFALIVTVAAARAIRHWDGAGPPWWSRAAAIATAIIAPYAVALVRARTAGPSPEVSRASPVLVGALLATGLVLALIAGLAVSRGGKRTTLLAACAGVAATGILAPSATAAWQLALPVALAVLLVVVLTAITDANTPDDDRGPRRAPFGAAVIALTAVLGLMSLARFATGRPVLSWRIRVTQLIDDARAVGRIAPATGSRLAGVYAAAQQVIPDGTRLGIWVERPDLIHYATHRVIDLRSKVVRRLDTIVPGLGLDYLLIDDAARAGPLQSFARRGATIHQTGGLRVVDVRGSR